MPSRTIGLLMLATGLAAPLVAAPSAGAHVTLHRCPSVRIARDDRSPLQVGDVSCREGDRLLFAWRHALARRPELCVPSNDGVRSCTLDHWRFTCPQTRNGHYYAVTARAEPGRGRLAFHYQV